MSEYTIPGGRNKGLPISEATDEDLVYWADRVGADLDSGNTPDRFRAKSIELHKAMVDELAQRGHAQQELPQAKPTEQKEPAPESKTEARAIPTTKSELATRPPAALTGSYRDEQKLNSIFSMAGKNYHLIAPASCPKLPEGCSIALSAIQVDQENETYWIAGKGEAAQLGLSKSALQKIGLAAGIAWDTSRSGRTDDGSDPYYCSWQAVGEMRLFDGTKVPLMGSKVMDLREGSPQIQALWERYEAAKKNPNKEAKDPTGQIREMRLHITSHAETKAQLRAIRSTGIRTSYKRAELNKPFLVARLMWTGETDDPVLRRKFAEMQAEVMIGASRALYGEPAAPALPRNAPPPVGSGKVDKDDLPDGDDL